VLGWMHHGSKGIQGNYGFMDQREGVYNLKIRFTMDSKKY